MDPGCRELQGLCNSAEAYQLDVAEAGIRITGLTPHGLFNGVQTLLQLLPASAGSEDVQLDCLLVRASVRAASCSVSVHATTVRAGMHIRLGCDR